MPIPTIEGLDPTLQAIATTIFVFAVAIFSAWSFVTGKRPKTETKEFALAGQLADMGPVKELVQQTGLLVQQQVRTNIALEAATQVDMELRDLLAAHLADQRAERAKQEAAEDLEDRAREIAVKIVAEMKKPRRSPRRTSPRPNG